MERKRRFHITLPSVSLAILALVVVLVMLIVMLVVVLVMLVVVLVVLLVVLVVLRILVIDVVYVYVVTPFYRAVEVVSLLESLPLSGCEHSPQLPVAAFPSVSVDVAVAADAVEIVEIDVEYTVALCF